MQNIVDDQAVRVNANASSRHGVKQSSVNGRPTLSGVCVKQRARQCSIVCNLIYDFIRVPLPYVVIFKRICLVWQFIIPLKSGSRNILG